MFERFDLPGLIGAVSIPADVLFTQVANDWVGTNPLSPMRGAY